MSTCLRWFKSKEFKVHGDFIDFCEVYTIQSTTIVQAITDAFIWLNLPILRCRGQTYDGASNMMGKKSSVAAEIIKLEPKAFCYTLSLSLSKFDHQKYNGAVSTFERYPRHGTQNLYTGKIFT